MGANRGREIRAGQRRGRTETDSGGEDRERDGCPPPATKIHKQMLVYLADVKLCHGEQRGNEFRPRERHNCDICCRKCPFVCLFVFVGVCLCGINSELQQ